MHGFDTTANHGTGEFCLPADPSAADAHARLQVGSHHRKQGCESSAGSGRRSQTAGVARGAAAHHETVIWSSGLL